MRSMRGDAALYFTFLTSCFWQRGATSATVRVKVTSSRIKVPSRHIHLKLHLKHFGMSMLYLKSLKNDNTKHVTFAGLQICYFLVREASDQSQILAEQQHSHSHSSKELSSGTRRTSPATGDIAPIALIFTLGLHKNTTDTVTNVCPRVQM